jgi:predicted nucleic acid-binding protein
VILVDSDVLVEQLRGNPAARDWLVEVRRTRGRLRASQVTAVELLGGMRSDERHRVRALVDSLELLDVDGRVARQAGVLMRQFPAVALRHRPGRLSDRSDGAGAGVGVGNPEHPALPDGRGALATLLTATTSTSSEPSPTRPTSTGDERSWTPTGCRSTRSPTTSSGRRGATTPSTRGTSSATRSGVTGNPRRCVSAPRRT